MELLKILIVSLMGIIVATSISIGVMIKGWGMEPKSWFWILGMGIGGQLFVQIFIQIASKE